LFALIQEFGMNPITVAIVGDDEHALKVKARLHDLDPSKIIVVGAVPHHYERPYASNPSDMDVLNIYNHRIGPLHVPAMKVAEPDHSCISDKMIALLARGNVPVKKIMVDPTEPQQG
jgi:hypothetical protein